MSNENHKDIELKELETREWFESLDYVIEHSGGERVKELLHQLQIRALKAGISIPFSANTPYINTIPREKQPPFPGDREIERRIKSLIRWNAMAMVVKANKQESGIGGHISTYASAATLYEIGFNHFFRGKGEEYERCVLGVLHHGPEAYYGEGSDQGEGPGEVAAYDHHNRADRHAHEHQGDHEGL